MCDRQGRAVITNQSSRCCSWPGPSKCVTANCIWIAEQEDLDVDMDAVRMAAMLHDYERRDDQVMDDSDTQLEAIMTSCGYGGPYIA